MLAFGVAVNDRRKNPQTGAWEDVPNFVDCIVFGSRAEAVSRFISKGSKVAQCRYTNNMETNRENYLIRRSTKLSFFPRELTFDKPVNDGLYSELNKLWGKSYHVIVVEEI